MTQNKKPNIQKLTDYINQQPDPERFMMALFSFCKPSADDLTRSHEETEIGVG